jgi:hypothetical protein
VVEERSNGPLTLAAPEPRLLEFEIWAHLAAAVMGREPEEKRELLRTKDVTEEDWMRADRHWSSVLAEEAFAGKMERPMWFGKLCRDEMVRRAAPARPAEPKAEPPAAEPSLPPPPVVEPQVPTFLLPNYAAEMGGPSDPVDVDATLEILVGTERTMPFGGTPSRAFSEWLASPPAAHDEPTASEDKLDRTVPGAIGSASPVLPFSADHPSPDMPVERYASLCAGLSVFPARSEEILARFGVPDARAREALDRAWREAFIRSAALFARWQELYATFRAAMAQAPDSPR